MEKREELALQKIILEIARTRIEIERLTEEIAVAQEAINKALRKPISAYHLQGMLNAANVIVDRKKALIESLVPLERKREMQMKAYQTAHRDRQMLTNMATRQRDAYEHAQARAQQKFLDDIFAARAQRS
ncbi:MAG: flagellar FliJ family protein [Terracidiphilus sp.]